MIFRGYDFIVVVKKEKNWKIWVDFMKVDISVSIIYFLNIYRYIVIKLIYEN